MELATLMICLVVRQILQRPLRINLSGQSKESDQVFLPWAVLFSSSSSPTQS